jgi:hypothetical protein
LDLDPPVLRCDYFNEAPLTFAHGNTHVDPKTGILTHGPKSFGVTTRHPATVRVGFIGSAEGIDLAHKWLTRCSTGFDGDEKHVQFPGFAADRGFFSSLTFDNQWRGLITQSEVRDILEIRSGRSRFEEALALFDSKLAILRSKDLPPQYVIVCPPTDVYNACRTVEYRDKDIGNVHRDFHRAFKGLAMKHQIPTQFLREQTADWRDKDHYSKICWNYFTGLYFKVGGVPWGPTGLTPGTCYMGVSFYRHIGSKLSKMQTGLVQAFDENGEGLVLRGPDFEWDSEKEGTASPHLTEPQAAQLADLVLSRYRNELGHTPVRMVVHKSSRFWEAERRGFEFAIKGKVQQYDFTALENQSTIRLLPASNYPPLRGTRFRLGDLDFLYSTGFLADLGQYHSMHVPAPIQVADHIGSDTPRDRILEEILVLTKMNWNSARLGGHLPITLRFSKLVGSILKEMPGDIEPLPNYKFYM